MSYIGGDPAAIRQFASSVIARRNQIEETSQRLTQLVESVPWVGEDRERFLDEWQAIHQPGIARLLVDLLGVSNEAGAAATRQDQASSGSW